VAAPIQAVVGDFHGLNTLEHQPTKIMALEGHFESQPDGAPLYLFGLPDEEAATVRYPVAIPKLGSLILHHSLDAPVAGLETVPRDQWPPVAVVFWSFRIMVGLGLLMVTLGAVALLARVRGRLYEWRALHGFAVIMGPAGFVAVIAGWVTTEVGRQPYTIYGLLRTADSVSPLAAPAVASSLVAFVVVYFAVFSVGAWYILRLMAHAPVPAEPGLEEGDAPIRTAGITPAPAVDPDRTIGSDTEAR
jgi:cytochrome d ubiquinol oxidase subunit I